MKHMAKNIGIDVKPPQTECNDKHCPFHGDLRVRGRIYEGVVVSDSMRQSVVIRRDYLYYVKKYHRYERRNGKITAHNPPCIKAKKGDFVRAIETRPLSKTVSFVVVEVLKS